MSEALSSEVAGGSSVMAAEVPHIRIAPSRGWMPLDLRDLWSYRGLFYFLMWRDVKVRYKQTALGAAWAVIQPLFSMLLFTLFFGRLANMPSDGIPYAVFSYAGLLPWTFFQNAITNSSNSLVGSSNLITKVYFPRMIIPAAAVGAGLVDLGIAFSVLVVLMIAYHVPFTATLLFLPVLALLTTALAVGVGMWLSALNVKYRDVRYALPFLVQFWMFASPVIYPTTLVPEKWRWLLMLNPMTGLIEGYRAALFVQREFDWLALGMSAVITFLLLVYGAYYFRRMERTFADVV